MEGEEVLGMGFIHPFPVVSVAFISEVPEDGSCKGRIGVSGVKEAGDINDAAINGLQGWLQSEVEGKLVFPASGCYAVDNVGALNATAVPGILRKTFSMVDSGIPHFFEYFSWIPHTF